MHDVSDQAADQPKEPGWKQYVVPSNFAFLGWLLLSVGLVALPAYLFYWGIKLTVTPAQALASGEDLLAKKRVLAIVAHPDDLEWYIGGTLRRLSDNGADVQAVVASFGEKSPHNYINAPDLAKAREQEQLRAAKINKYTVRFLRMPDRGVAGHPDFALHVQKLIDEVQPDAILVFDPEYPSLPYLHTDHQGTGRVVLREWRRRGSRQPIYLFQSRIPNTAVDITSVIDIKAEAFEQHMSQNGSDSSGMRGFHERRGKEVGVGFAELFRRLP